MTAMLAIVWTAEDMPLAAAAGADRVALLTDGSTPDFLFPTVLRGRADVGLMAVEGAASVNFARSAIWASSSLALLPLDSAWRGAAQAARAGGANVIGVVCPSRPFEDHLVAEATTLGFSGLHISESTSTGERLLDRRSSAELLAWVAGCREQKLSVGFSGALEAADVPRLLALGPDHLGFDVALRDGAGHFDPDRVRVILDVLASSEPRSGATASNDTVPDRIFVRDWTIAMSIGAYAHERGKLQRVRCSVEVVVRRSAAAITGMAHVVSYDLITDAIARLAAEHIDLVETFAERLAAEVLIHPRVASVDVTVEKLDVGPGAVGCRVVRGS